MSTRHPVSPPGAARVAPDSRPAARSGQGAPAPALPGAAGPSRAAGLVAGPDAVRGRRGRDPHAAHGLERRRPAVAALRARGLLVAARLAGSTPVSTLESLVRPAGTYRLKARRLLEFTRWLLARFGGDFRAMGRAPLGPLRREVLAVSGLGPETADAILLYAAGRPVFVADAYTRRVLARHRLMSGRGAGTRMHARCSKPTCLRIPRSSTSFMRCWWPSPRSHCRTVPHCASCPLRFDLGGRPPAPVRG